MGKVAIRPDSGGVTMIRLKGCPRCKGDILIDRDHVGWYEQCIQCGYLHDIEPSVKRKVYRAVYVNTPNGMNLTTEVSK